MSDRKKIQEPKWSYIHGWDPKQHTVEIGDRTERGTAKRRSRYSQVAIEIKLKRYNVYLDGEVVGYIEQWEREAFRKVGRLRQVTGYPIEWAWFVTIPGSGRENGYRLSEPQQNVAVYKIIQRVFEKRTEQAQQSEIEEWEDMKIEEHAAPEGEPKPYTARVSLPEELESFLQAFQGMGNLRVNNGVAVFEFEARDLWEAAQISHGVEDEARQYIGNLTNNRVVINRPKLVEPSSSAIVPKDVEWPTHLSHQNSRDSRHWLPSEASNYVLRAHGIETTMDTKYDETR